MVGYILYNYIIFSILYDVLVMSISNESQQDLGMNAVIPIEEFRWGSLSPQ